MADVKRDQQSLPVVTQVARFIETARALGCDESEAAFDGKLEAVVGPKSSRPNVDGKPSKS